MSQHDSVIIAVDFDGTIVRHEFPRIGELIPGAVEWLLKFQQQGVKLILYTMRDDVLFDKYLEHAVSYCEVRGLKFWGYNVNHDQRYWSCSPKVYAHIYIDDAAIGCPLIYPEDGRPYANWEKIGPLVEKRIAELNERTMTIHVPEETESA